MLHIEQSTIDFINLMISTPILRHQHRKSESDKEFGNRKHQYINLNSDVLKREKGLEVGKVHHLLLPDDDLLDKFRCRSGSFR